MIITISWYLNSPYPGCKMYILYNLSLSCQYKADKSPLWWDFPSAVREGQLGEEVMSGLGYTNTFQYLDIERLRSKYSIDDCLYIYIHI